MVGVRSFFLFVVIVLLFVGCYGDVIVVVRGYIKYKDLKVVVEERVEDLLIWMILFEKFG